MRITPLLRQRERRAGGWIEGDRNDPEIGAAVSGSGNLADLTGGHEESDGRTTRIGHGVQPGVRTAHCAIDQTATPPLF